MIAFVRSFPPDPETDLKNFQRKQAEYEAAYHRTEEPFVLYEALLHADPYLQFPVELSWLVTAVGNVIMRDRTKNTAERFKERMRHVQRYRCVRDLREKGHKKDQALELAIAKLEATDAAAMRGTIEVSYDKVSRDLKKKGRESEFFWLVARSDPTLVPVCVSQTQSGEVTVNGVVQPEPNDQGVDRSPNDLRGRSFVQRSGG